MSVQILQQMAMDANMATTKLGRINNALPDLKQIDRIRKGVERTNQTIKNFDDAFGKSQKELKRVQEGLGKALPELKELKRKAPQIENMAKEAGKLAKIGQNLKKTLDSTIFKKVLPAKAGALLGSFAQLASAGMIVVAAKTAEEVQQYDLEKERLVNSDLQRQMNLIVKNDAVVKSLQRRVNANDAAIDILAGGIGEKTKYIDRIINEFQLKLEGNQAITEVQKQQIANLANSFNDITPKVNQSRVEIKNIQAQIASIIGRATAQPSANQAQINQLSTKVSVIEKEVKIQDKEINEIKKASNLPANVLQQVRNAVNSSTSALTKLGKLERELPGTVTKLVEKGVQDLIKEANKDVAKEVNKEITKLDAKKADKRDLTDEIAKTKDALATLINGQVAPFNAQLEVVKVGLSAVNNQLTEQRIDINKTKQDVTKQGTDIDALKQGNKEIDKMNREGNKKLDDLLKWSLGIAPILTAIPARTGQLINPNIPSKPDIAQIVRNNTPQQTCRFDATPINRHTTVLDAAQTALITANATVTNTINSKLGPSLENGGISGAIKRLFENAIVDKMIRYLTFVATMHNAMMLSNNIFQTLFTAVDNLANLVGISMKDAEGNQINLSTSVSNFFSNSLKAMFGEETVKNISTVWNAANRIYQSVVNATSIIQSMQQTILTALEYIAAGQGKVANALKAAGKVFENAYEWMNVQPNFDNPIFVKLNKFQESASTIEQLTQTPLDIKNQIESLKEEKKNMGEVLKDGENALKGLGVIESDKEKSKATESKQASAGKDLDDSDKTEADD